MEKDNSGGSQTKVPSDQSDKERDKDKTMKIITPNPKEVENPLKKLRIITIILSIIVIFGVASYYLYSNTFQGRGTPPTLVGQKLEKFKSEEEFRKFIEEGEAQMESGMVGLMGRTPAMVSDEVSLEAPVGVGAEISREQTSQPYRVSETNVQVKGIDEPDILKTDGNNIYYSSQSFYRGVPEPLPLMELRSDIAPPFNQTPATKVVEAFPPENLKELSEIEDTGEMLLYQNYLIVFGNRKITGYDVSNITNPEKIWTSQLEDKNQIVTSRLMNDTIYLITSTGVSTFDPCVIPVMSGASTLRVSCTDIYRPPRTFPANSTYTVMKLDPSTGRVNEKTSFIGNSSSSVVYMSPNAVYVTYTISEGYSEIFMDFFIEETSDLFPESLIGQLEKIKSYDISLEAKMVELEKILSDYNASLSRDEEVKLSNELENRLEDYIKSRSREIIQTGIAKIDVSNFQVTSSAVFPGQPLNQFSLDEYNGFLRIATTVGGGMFGSDTSANDVYVLDASLNIVGQVTDLGLTERVYSVRFIQDKGYVVTFRQIDPFYVLDLSDPKNPQLKGELKIPGYSSYLHPIDKDNLVGVGKEGNNVKISLFNVDNPQSPLEVDKYDLDEFYSEVLDNHHAFLMDYENEVFFMPAAQGGYIFSYTNNTLSLERVVADIQAKRALFINNYLYIAADDAIVVLNMQDWEEVNRLIF